MANSKPEIKYTKIFINNKFIDAIEDGTYGMNDPVTEEVLVWVSEGTETDVNLAVDAAKKAFECGSTYRNMDASARGRLLWRLAELFERDSKTLASLETLESGKPINNALSDVNSSINCLKYYAKWCDKIDHTFAMKPIGVVGQIISWTHPLFMLACKWGPAIAAGCTIVTKPARETPLTALYSAALSAEAGFPDGVINVVPSYCMLIEHVIRFHPDVRKTIYTGVLDARNIILPYAERMKLTQDFFELGGKSPLVVMDDVDVKEAALIAHKAVFDRHSQCCYAGINTFVHEKVYDEFVAVTTKLARKRKVGNPFDETVQHGPIVNSEHFFFMLEYLKGSKKRRRQIEGHKVETGGKRLRRKGYFIESTVLSDVTDDMLIARQEIYGPIQCILKFKTLEEVIERANKQYFGLFAGIITKDPEVAQTFSSAIKAGPVWVNYFNGFECHFPYGGFRKFSDGREHELEGVHLYLETKTEPSIAGLSLKSEPQ